MTFANVTHDKSQLASSASRHRLLFRSQPHAPDHISEETFAEISQYSLDCLQERVRNHLVSCTECAHSYAMLRAATVLRMLPRKWQAVVSDHDDHYSIEGNRFHIFGTISIESWQFEASTSDLEWTPQPLHIRLNLVVDLDLALFSITTLDVPSDISAISVLGPEGWVELTRIDDHDTLEADIFYEPERLRNASFADMVHFIDFFRAGRIRLTFVSRTGGSATIDDIHDFIYRLGIVDHDGPYWLPNGLRVDKHINLAKLCESTFAVDHIAEGFARTSSGAAFDCILCHGWSMAVVGRRLASTYHASSQPPQVIVSVGYSPPTLMADITRCTRVLILVDIVVTGRLINELSRIVTTCGALVVGVGAIVDGREGSRGDSDGVQSLCHMDLGIQDGAADCRSTAPLEELVYNPFAAAMTKRCRASRSASEFLADDDKVRNFWMMVDRADAYAFHKKERHTHYLAFIDTLKLIQHPDVGESVLNQFSGSIFTNFALPDVILVPGQRARAKLLASKLIRRMRDRGGAEPRLVVARRWRDRWSLHERDFNKIDKSRVLVIDTAVGHGKTLEDLCQLAERHQASGVGGAVLIGRLTTAAERALDRRLCNGFVAQFHVPFQPFAIRGSHFDLCPVCAEKAAIAEAKTHAGPWLFDAWEKWLNRTPVGRAKTNKKKAERPRGFRQLNLYHTKTDDFLTQCRPKIAGAITLHSLGTAQTNGMASLAIPELQDPHLKARTKIAMLEHLPPHILEWSGKHLERQLEGVLQSSRDPGLWRAAATVMSRENRDQWYECLEQFLHRCDRLHTESAAVFWGCMTWNAYVSSQADTEYRSRLQRALARLIETFQESAACDGLGRMLSAASCAIEK